MFPTEIIKKKRNGQELSLDEIRFFIEGYTRSEIPDYQMSALLMAILLKGMDSREGSDLAQVMLDSGERITFPTSPTPVDKHSTGGVGDKTSLILAPIVAACGIPVPMMSGRGLGHTGGTLDKLESIPGFNTSQNLTDFQRLVKEHHLCFIGQTDTICPADKKIYSLRDVTGTVESLPLICASIMSKKIAEGIDGLVLDVKVGSGAFMKTIEDARALAKGLIAIGKQHNLTCKALITNMNQPLGRFVGNSLEVFECLAILKQEGVLDCDLKDFADTQELSLQLSAEMIAIGKNISIGKAYEEALQALVSGKAYEKFCAISKAQGGSIEKLPLSQKSSSVLCTKSGYIHEIKTEAIGIAGIALGAGRKIISDKIDPVAGIQIHKKIGDAIKPGDCIFTIHHGSFDQGLSQANELLHQALVISSSVTKPTPLVIEKI